MPWTIWPALVVLWGVCWMFHPPETGSAESIFGQASDYDFLELYPSQIGTWETDNSVLGPYSTLDWSAMAPLDTSGWPLPPQTDAPNLELQQPLTLPICTDTTAPAVTQFGSPAYVPVASPFTQTAQAQEEFPLVAVPIASSSRMNPPHGVTITSKQDEPDVNNQRDMICMHEGCENLAFTHKREWKRHMDRHDRPFRCSPCDHSFGSKHDLKRHQRSKHLQERNFLCNEPGCGRSREGFVRKDHLTQHIREVHRKEPSQDEQHGPVEPCSMPRDRKIGASLGPRKRQHREFFALEKEELIEELLSERDKRQRLEKEVERMDRCMRILEGQVGKKGDARSGSEER